MPTLNNNNALKDDANLRNRELVYVAGLIMLGVIFATVILSGTIF